MAAPETDALACNVAAPMLDTDAGEIATSATPALLVNAVVGFKLATLDPLVLNVTTVPLAGAPEGPRTVARATYGFPIDMPVTAFP